MARVLITARSVAANGQARSVLESAGHEPILHVQDRPHSETEMLPIIRGMDAAIVGLDAITSQVIAAGTPSLKIIARNGVGYSNVDLKAAADLRIPVTLTPGANTISVCELTMGLMLALARNIVPQNDEVHRGGWGRIMSSELYGKTLGIIGMGHVGFEVARRAHAFGMNIVAFDIIQRPELSQYDVKYVSIEDVFRAADFLTLHTPATPATRNLVNAQTLATMKKTAFIINTARGELVHEADLYDALAKRSLAGYAADTFVQEPPATNHPLLSLSNVVFTPHCGAYTKEAVERSSVTAAQEVVRVLAGQAPLYAVRN